MDATLACALAEQEGIFTQIKRVVKHERRYHTNPQGSNGC